MRADVASGSPCRSVAAGPAASFWLATLVPSTTLCGVGASLSSDSRSARGSGLGDGLLVWGVCACAPATERATTSNNPARDVLFIRKFRAILQNLSGGTSVA